MWILLIFHLATGQMTSIEFGGQNSCGKARTQILGSISERIDKHGTREAWEGRRENAFDAYQKFADAGPQYRLPAGEEVNLRQKRYNFTRSLEARQFNQFKTHTEVDAICFER